MDKQPSPPSDQRMYAIGIDVGGTKIAGGLVELATGALLTRRQSPTNPARGGAAVLDDTLALATALQTAASAQGITVLGIGVGVAELVDQQGTITSAHTIPWRGVAVGQCLARIAPTVIESDVRAHALAEARYGAGRTLRQFVFVTVGTGISSCVVLDGRPQPGRRKLIREFIAHAALFGIALLFLIPFIWLILTSLKPLSQVFANPLTWLPNPIQWDNYVKALTSPAFPFPRLLANTVFYAVASTVGTVLSSAVVAYAFARMQFRGRDFLFGVTLATMMLPGIVTLIPTYVMFRLFGWVGSYAPLVVPLWFGSAFNIFLLRQFMLTIPLDLTDAARVDGATDGVILWKVMLPLIQPALLVVGLFQFLASWNDFMGPLIYLTNSEQFPLVLGLYSFTTRMNVQWNLLLAASVAVMLPMVVLFFLAQRYFIEGVVMTGLKGA